MDIYDTVEKIADLTLEYGEKRMTERSYAYSFGMFLAEIQADLSEMNLTQKQMNILINRVETLKRKLPEFCALNS